MARLMLALLTIKLVPLQASPVGLFKLVAELLAQAVPVVRSA